MVGLKNCSIGESRKHFRCSILLHNGETSLNRLLQLPPSPIYGSAFSAVRSLLSHSVSTPVAWHTYKGRSRTHEQSIGFVLRPEVVCTYIFVPFATVGLCTGSESLFGSDTLAPRAKDRQFPLGTRLLYFDTGTRKELGVPLCSDAPQLLV